MKIRVLESKSSNFAETLTNNISNTFKCDIDDVQWNEGSYPKKAKMSFVVYNVSTKTAEDIRDKVEQYLSDSGYDIWPGHSVDFEKDFSYVSGSIKSAYRIYFNVKKAAFLESASERFLDYDSAVNYVENQGISLDVAGNDFANMIIDDFEELANEDEEFSTVKLDRFIQWAKQERLKYEDDDDIGDTEHEEMIKESNDKSKEDIERKLIQLIQDKFKYGPLADRAGSSYFYTQGKQHFMAIPISTNSDSSDFYSYKKDLKQVFPNLPIYSMMDDYEMVIDVTRFYRELTESNNINLSYLVDNPEKPKKSRPSGKLQRQIEDSAINKLGGSMFDPDGYYGKVVEMPDNISLLDFVAAISNNYRKNGYETIFWTNSGSESSKPTKEFSVLFGSNYESVDYVIGVDTENSASGKKYYIMDVNNVY